MLSSFFFSSLGVRETNGLRKWNDVTSDVDRRQSNETMMCGVCVCENTHDGEDDDDDVKSDGRAELQDYRGGRP